MTYQPLAEVRKTLRVKWYRSKVDHTILRNLSKRSDLQGWFQAGGHLALWLLTGSLVYFFGRKRYGSDFSLPYLYTAQSPASSKGQPITNWDTGPYFLLSG